MKIISRRAFYNREVYTVQLDENDVSKSDYDLVRECDGWGKAPFGGAVKRNGNTAEVSVYID